MLGHATFALIFGLPEAPTAMFIVALVIVLGYVLLNSYSKTLRAEIGDLRSALNSQSERHRTDVEDLNEKVDRLELQYDEQRGLKHKALNDVAKTVMALDLVERLAEQCTCGALAPLKEIIRRLVSELSTLAKASDPRPGGTL